ncbi:uncharacterized protein MEPE_01802 [Melanopsichium pennsylvanicum]|uniref:Uncharacterized protein n=1 Tax=Melanopsichium pennsylvanicum TaxID=63383 RepID=A0AAJ4XJS2_9BASI|nr:uncharacterized protein MEPE_01802 [Melanopsichium pennsylvanicum]
MWGTPEDVEKPRQVDCAVLNLSRSATAGHATVSKLEQIDIAQSQECVKRCRRCIKKELITARLGAALMRSAALSQCTFTTKCGDAAYGGQQPLGDLVTIHDLNRKSIHFLAYSSQ